MIKQASQGCKRDECNPPHKETESEKKTCGHCIGFRIGIWQNLTPFHDRSPGKTRNTRGTAQHN